MTVNCLHGAPRQQRILAYYLRFTILEQSRNYKTIYNYKILLRFLFITNR